MTARLRCLMEIEPVHFINDERCGWSPGRTRLVTGDEAAIGRRWRIEDFHKACKSGTRVEELRPRAADNLKRGVVVLAFVAIRLLQLQELVYPPTSRPGQPQRKLAQQPCDTILTATEWCVLYMAIHQRAPPAQPPSAE